MSQLPAPSLIAELEVRQDEALQSLAELEQRIEQALSEFIGVSPIDSKGGENRRSAGAGKPDDVELKLHVPDEATTDEAKPAAA